MVVKLHELLSENLFFEKNEEIAIIGEGEVEYLSSKPWYDRYLSRKNVRINGVVLRDMSIKVRNYEGRTEFVRANIGGREEYILFVSQYDFKDMCVFYNIPTDF